MLVIGLALLVGIVICIAVHGIRRLDRWIEAEIATGPLSDIGNRKNDL